MAKVAEFVIRVAILFGMVCLGVFLFSLQFDFDWSFLLCVCVYIAMIALRVTFKE